jgi:hypothetical protein
MGHAQVAFDFMRVSIPAPPVPGTVAVAEGNDQVDTSDVEGAGRGAGQRPRGRGTGGRGWRKRGNNRGERRNDGKARSQ